VPGYRLSKKCNLMKKIVTWLTLFLLIAFISQWVIIKYLPNIVYKIAIHRVHNNFNTWINSGKTDAGMRRVVMPNPDFVYSALFYDVSDRNIKVSGVFPDSTYASISFYDDRCQPYYVYNNLDSARTGKFELDLVKDGTNDAHSVKVKTERGVIICRFLKSTDSSYQQLVPYQKMLKCE
jgi:uncharacterized membrane protein